MTTTRPRRRCIVCGKPLTTPPTGRPPDFCSVGCRRSQEYELRRVQARLTAREDERHGLKVRLAEYAVSAPLGTKVVAMARARLETVEQAIAADTLRLRDLLAASSTDEELTPQ